MKQFTKKYLLWVASIALVFSFFISLPLSYANGTPEPMLEECDKVGYSKGFYIKTCDDDFKLKINLQLQPQYQFVAVENQANNGKTHTFQLRRARIIFSGNAFYPELTYKFQLEAKGGRVSTPRDADVATGPNLRDGWLNYKVSNGFNIKAGQFKTAHNREELTSSSKLQFVDRSINNEVFTFARSLALMFHGSFFEKQLEYAIFVANDVARRNVTNFNNEIVAGGKIVWNALGYHGYTMSDIKGHDEVALSFGLGAAIDRPMVAANDPTLISPTFDVALMYAGFSFIGEFNYLRNHTASTNTLGFLGQVGYFLVPEHFEVALRGAAVIPKGLGTNGYEAGGALNYFFKGHNLKLQADYNLLFNSALSTGTGGTTAPANINRTGGLPGFIQNQNDHRIRLQAQLYI